MARTDRPYSSSPASNVIKQNEFLPITEVEPIQQMYFEGYSGPDPQYPQRVLLSDMVSAIPEGSIDGSMIADGSIGTNHLQDDSVTQDKIADGAVGDTQISPEGIDASNIKNLVIYFDKIVRNQNDWAEVISGSFKRIFVRAGQYTFSNAVLLPSTVEKLVGEEGTNVSITGVASDQVLFSANAVDIEEINFSLTGPFSSGYTGILCGTISHSNITVTTTGTPNTEGQTSVINADRIFRVNINQTTGSAISMSNRQTATILESNFVYQVDANSVVCIREANKVENVIVSYEGAPGIACSLCTNLNEFSTDGTVADTTHIINSRVGRLGLTYSCTDCTWVVSCDLFGLLQDCNFVSNNRIYFDSPAIVFDTCTFVNNNYVLLEDTTTGTLNYQVANNSKKVVNNTIQINRDSPTTNYPALNWGNSYATWEENDTYACAQTPQGGFNEGLWSQSVPPSLSINPSAINFNESGGTSNVTVTATVDWEVVG